MTIETLQAYYNFWYSEVMTKQIPMAVGHAFLPEKPDWSTGQREEPLSRSDVHIQVSGPQRRCDPLKGAALGSLLLHWFG